MRIISSATSSSPLAATVGARLPSYFSATAVSLPGLRSSVMVPALGCPSCPGVQQPVLQSGRCHRRLAAATFQFRNVQPQVGQAGTKVAELSGDPLCCCLLFC